MFDGQRFLVVEARDFVTEELRQKLDELGASMVGPVANVEDALVPIDKGEATWPEGRDPSPAADAQGEEATDKKLTQLAEASANPKAKTVA